MGVVASRDRQGTSSSDGQRRPRSFRYTYGTFVAALTSAWLTQRGEDKTSGNVEPAGQICSPPLARHVKAAVDGSLLRRLDDLFKGASFPERDSAGRVEHVHPLLFERGEHDLIDQLWALSARADVWHGLNEEDDPVRLADPETPPEPPPRLPLRSIQLVEHDSDSLQDVAFGHHGATMLAVHVQLSRSGVDHEGGELDVRRLSGEETSEADCVETFSADRGDVVAWRGWDESRTAPVLFGTRRALLIEWWPARSYVDRTHATTGETARGIDTEAGIREALRIDPSAALLHAALATHVLSKHGAEKAEAHYLDALRAAPRHSGCAARTRMRTRRPHP